MNYLPLLVIAVVLIGAMSLTRRSRQRAIAQQTELREKIGFGSDVMTTSGLYGTVVGINDDDSVQLAIAPGVEVKWAAAALRDVPPAAQPRPQGADSPEDEPPEPKQN